MNRRGATGSVAALRLLPMLFAPTACNGQGDRGGVEVPVPPDDVERDGLAPAGQAAPVPREPQGPERPAAARFLVALTKVTGSMVVGGDAALVASRAGR